ncbi:MAG TPA: EamA family transporter [Patescibacteria group bacterium]|nr:EamA family transporter [Patescibacteria group bacterium]
MNWIIFALGAIGAGAISDLFRKLGSNLRDPFLSNLLFQGAGFATAIILYFIFSRKLEGNPYGILYAAIGGIFISIFTALSFKALSDGPGVSTVMPVLRIGVVLLVVILGILLFREKLTWNIVLGVLLAGSGVYILFLNK